MGYQLTNIYGEHAVFESTDGKINENKTLADYSIAQAALAAGIGVGFHFIPQIASGLKVMWTTRTPIPQVCKFYGRQGQR